MKITALSLLLSLTVASQLLEAAGLFQRMAVAAGKYRIGSSGKVRVPAICLDQSRPAPFGKSLNYHFGETATVRSGGRSFTLAEAMAQGIVQALGDGSSGVTFQSKLPVEIDFPKGSILSHENEPPDPLRIDVARDFKQQIATTPAIEIRSGAQIPAWNRIALSEVQTVLKSLGLYGGAIDGKPGPATATALEKAGVEDISEALFDLDGLLGKAIQQYATLQPAARTIVDERLSTILDEQSFEYPTLPERVKAVQQLAGVDADGIVTPDFPVHLKQAAALRSELNLAGFGQGRDPQQQLTRARDYYKVADAPDQSNRLRQLLAADIALARSIMSSRAATSALPAKVKVLDNGVVTRNALVETSRGRELWVAHSRGIVARSEGDKAVEELEAKALFSSRLVSARDASVMYVPSVRTQDQRVKLQLGPKRLEIARDSWQAFLNGTQRLPELDAELAAPTPPKRIIVARDGFFQNAPPVELAAITDFGGAFFPERMHSNPTAIARALTRDYGSKLQVVLASNVSEAAYRAAEIPRVTKHSDLAVYASGNLETWGLLPTNSSTFGGTAFPVHWTPAPVEATNIIVISGHRGPEFDTYLGELQASGALKGKLVVLMACYAGACEARHSRLTTGENAAAGILFYGTPVIAPAVRNVMVHLNRLLDGKNIEPALITDFLQRAIDAALEDGGSPTLLEEIKKLRHAILQITHRWNTTTKETRA